MNAICPPRQSCMYVRMYLCTYVCMSVLFLSLAHLSLSLSLSLSLFLGFLYFAPFFYIFPLHHFTYSSSCIRKATHSPPSAFLSSYFSIFLLHLFPASVFVWVLFPLPSLGDCLHIAELPVTSWLGWNPSRNVHLRPSCWGCGLEERAYASTWFLPASRIYVFVWWGWVYVERGLRVYMYREIYHSFLAESRN